MSTVFVAECISCERRTILVNTKLYTCYLFKAHCVKCIKYFMCQALVGTTQTPVSFPFMGFLVLSALRCWCRLIWSISLVSCPLSSGDYTACSKDASAPEQTVLCFHLKPFSQASQYNSPLPANYIVLDIL